MCISFCFSNRLWVLQGQEPFLSAVLMCSPVAVPKFVYLGRKYQRPLNIKIVLKELYCKDHPFCNYSAKIMEGQAALGHDNSVVCQAVQLGRVMSQWSKPHGPDGVVAVHNRPMKNDPVRCCLILWKSYESHGTKVLYSRARDIPGMWPNRICKGRDS